MLSKLLCFLLGHRYIVQTAEIAPALVHIWCNRCGRQEIRSPSFVDINPEEEEDEPEEDESDTTTAEVYEYVNNRVEELSDRLEELESKESSDLESRVDDLESDMEDRISTLEDSVRDMEEERSDTAMLDKAEETLEEAREILEEIKQLASKKTAYRLRPLQDSLDEGFVWGLNPPSDEFGTGIITTLCNHGGQQPIVMLHKANPLGDKFLEHGRQSHATTHESALKELGYEVSL